MGFADTTRTVAQRATRTAVAWGLRGARLPLDTVERGARRAGVDVSEWYPARLFEGVAADTKRVVGQLVRDQALVEDGRRERVRVEDLRRARMLRREAQRLGQVGDERLERQGERAGHQHEVIDKAGRALERQREGERAVARAAARLKAQREAARADAVDDQRQDLARRARRHAEETRLAEESAVVDRQRAAAGGGSRRRRTGCRRGPAQGPAPPFFGQRRVILRAHRLTAAPPGGGAASPRRQRTRPRPVTSGRSSAVRRPGGRLDDGGDGVDQAHGRCLQPSGVVVAVGPHELQIDRVDRLAA